ncbi:protein TASOR isoform X2 [Gouania willdenowi]|nr:protein TASOR isoform X2 [Gouania willdenowi]
MENRTMDGSSAARRELGRPPRRLSAAAAELGGCLSPKDVEDPPGREARPGPDRPSFLGGFADRRTLAQQEVHRRHMPIEPLKLTIPRKTKENRGLLSYVSMESREYEEMMSVLTSSYVDTTSTGTFVYSNPRLVNNQLLEREFVEKRREMKAEGRTEKELEESYCFLLTDSTKLPTLCEKGVCVSQSRITVLGNPTKGVYLCRYSDLLHFNLLTPGSTGEILIFKVMKGKVKSIYENMKNLLDPTPRFDSHVSKNASKVTSLSSYRAFELTQQYFYEYSFDELRQRPRQACPYAVMSFHFKGKDAPLPSMPLAPVRASVQSVEETKERSQYVVWSGDLVKDGRVLFQVSFRCWSPPLLPHKLPDKVDIGHVMRLDHVTKHLPSSLLSYELYSSSREVVKGEHFCSLLEVIDRSRSTSSVTRLMNQLETKKVVLVIPLSERGFLFLLSSVQMAPPAERGKAWRRSLQALFVFPQTRDVTNFTPPTAASTRDASQTPPACMPQLRRFIPALHQALIKAKANPPPELSAGVELQAREYLSGLKDGKVRQYPMGEYDSTLDETGAAPPTNRIPRVNMDSYLRCYLSAPVGYLLSLPRVRQMVEAHCVPETTETLETPMSHKEALRKEPQGSVEDGSTNSQKIQQLINLVMTCKKSAEKEVRKEEADALKLPGRKRKLEQEMAARALKFLKASQETEKQECIPGDRKLCPSPVSYSSVIGSAGLRDSDLTADGSDLCAKLLHLLTGLNQTASGAANHSNREAPEAEPKESSPFERLATKLGLPTHCDIDLRKQEELEEQTAGSVSSLEGFSPASLSGDTNSHGGGKLSGRKIQSYELDHKEQVEIPWILIPITGVDSERYTRRDRNLPQDPRFQHIATATTNASTTKPVGRSPAPSPPPSPDSSPVVSPEPSPPPPQQPRTWSHMPHPLVSHSDPANEQPLVHTVSEEVLGASDVQHLHQETLDSPSVRTLDVVDSELKVPSLPVDVDSGNVDVPQQSDKEVVEEEEEVTKEGEACAAPPSIDVVVDKHLSSFSTEMQRLLQKENILYCFPQSPHSTSHSESCAPPHYAPLSPFSQYVSFYNPCPPVQDYMSSLHHSISSMLAHWDGTAPHAPPPADEALASSVSAFVASVRAGNSSVDGEACQCDVIALGTQSSAPLREERANTPECPPLPSVGVEGDGPVDISQTSAEPDSRLGSAPPATALNSLIRQLQPEVFSNLMEIMKDVKKNSIHFYLHSMEVDHQDEGQIKDHLLKQGNAEQSPMDFLKQETSDARLLVIIKNEDIAAHVHKIPCLVSLKRHPSVVFMGIDTLDDIRNNSYNELFVSGGCVMSDDLILSPDVVSHDRLAMLLMFVERHSSPESIWKWKIHYKTMKKLKEQARFKRDAAKILDVVVSYQKRQFLEVLPYHCCDSNKILSPDLTCVKDHQARYTQYRHTILLTEQGVENMSSFTDGGMVVCSSEQLLSDFSRLTGYQDERRRQHLDDLLLPGGLDGRPTQDESAASSSGCPSLQELPRPQPGSVPPALDALQPSDCKMLQMAIAQLRAERLEQLKLLQEQKRHLEAQLELTISPPPMSPQPSPDSTGRSSPPIRPAPRVVAATLDLNHSSLNEDRPQSAVGAPGGAGLTTEGVELLGEGAGSQREPCPSKKTESATNGPTDMSADRSDVSVCTTTSAPVGGDKPRATPPGQEQPITVKTAPLGKPPLPVTVVTGSGFTAATHQQVNNWSGCIPSRPAASLFPHLLQQQGRSLLGPRPYWPARIAPPGGGPAVWGQHRLDSCAPLMWFPFQHPSAQGRARPYGAPRGRGFNGT